MLYLYDTGICHSVWVASGLLVGLNPIQYKLQLVWSRDMLAGCCQPTYHMTIPIAFYIELDSIQPADQTPPIQSDKYQCRVDTAFFLLMIGT